MVLASALGDTIGLAAIFFVVFPLLVNGILVLIGVQVFGERRANQSARYDEPSHPSQDP
jgi:hypothetical protein